MSEQPSGDMAAELERDLRRVLAPARPDPEAFRKRVAEKIAQREARYVPGMRGRILRRAAGFLPPDLASSALAGGAASLTLKSVLAKSTAWTLAFPAAVLAMTAASFVMGVRTVRGGLSGDRVDGATAHRALAELEIAAWWRRNWPFPLLVLGTGLYLKLREPAWLPNFALLGLMLATVGLVVLLRTLDRAGLASRANVGRLVSQFLCAFTATILWHFSMEARWPIEQAEQITPLWIVVVLAVGYACHWFGSLEDRLGRPRVERWLVPTAIGLFLVAFLPFSWRRFGATRGELAEFVEEFEERPEHPYAWRGLVSVARWLDECGYRELDLAAASRAARAAVDDGGHIHDEMVGAAAWLALLDAERWDVVFAGSPYPHGFVLDSVVGHGPRDRLRVGFDSTVAGWIRATVFARELSDDERDRLAEAILQDWPNERAELRIEHALAICDALDALDRGDLVADKGPEVRALLASHWRHEDVETFRDAGFTAGGRLADHVSDGTARAGIELMIRFGVPPEVDLKALQASVKQETRRLFAWRPVTWLNVEDCVALDRLVTRLPMAKRTPLESLFAYRLQIALAMLVALCVYATLRAPKQAEVAPPRRAPLPDVPAPSAGE